MEFTIWELLRHEKISETHVLAALLVGYAWLFNRKKRSLEYHQVINKLVQNLRFLEVCVTQVQ